MHSFSAVSVLLAAALASFTNAAPVSVPSSVNLPVAGGKVNTLLGGATGATGTGGKVSTLLGGATGVTGTGGVVNTVEGDVNTLVGGVATRDVESTVADAVKSIESKFQTRQTVGTSTLSVAAIFTNIQTEIAPFTAELTYLTPSNCTVSSVTTIIANIKAPIVAAIPQIQALAGQPTNVIMGGVDGSSILSVAQVVTVVGPVFSTLLSASGSLVTVAGAQSDVISVATDLMSVLSTLLSVVVSLVGGILALLSPLLAPGLTILSGSGVLSVLGLNSFSALLGLTGLNL